MSSLFKSFSVIALCALVVGFSNPVNAQQELSTRSAPISIRAVQAATVLIESSSHKGVLLGSGVVTTILGKKYVLTANHIIRGTAFARLTSLADGSSGMSKETGGWHVEYDIAAIPLPVSMSHLPALELHTGKLRPGEKIYIASFPKGFPAITFGRISGYGNHGTRMFHTALTAEGSSGGMIIDEKGRLCGVHLGVDRFYGCKVATPSDLVIRLVNIHGKR